MRPFALATLAACVVACGNDLPPSGSCPSPGAAAGPLAVDAVHLADGIYFDDLAYAPARGQVVAAPEGARAVYLIDPATAAVTALPLPVDVATADAFADLVVAADRAHREVVVIDPTGAAIVSSIALSGGPDYVRVSPIADEVWVTMPGADRIDVLALVRASSPPHLERVTSIAIPGSPEGLVFDIGNRLAYTQNGGRLIAIDTTSRRVVGDWDTGCAGSHGFPMADAARGLAIAGCNDNGGSAVLRADTGDVKSGFEAGGGEAVLAYAPALGHFYLRGDPGPVLSILGVCDDGAMTLLGTAMIPNYGHAMAADEAGHVWVADPDHGGVVRVTDPFPPMP